ncbi:hypothetical protein DCOP10_10310 [Armatimonadetes bacterium DC]|nr:hypothetical protein DCOP10_10310 [Armatimonadetes bacterium DC]
MFWSHAAEIAPRKVVALGRFIGRLWAACYGQGLYVMEGGCWRLHPTAPKGLTGLYADTHRLWFCTWMEGEIGYITDVNNAPKRIPLPRLVTPRFAYRTFCIVGDANKLWIGSQTHLLRLDIGSQEEVPEWDIVVASDWVNSVVPTRKGVWVVTAGELWVYKESAQGFSFRAVRSDIGITAMALGVSGKELWIGSKANVDGMLWRYEIETQKWQQITRVPISSEGIITAVLPVKHLIFISIGSMGFGTMPPSSVQRSVGVYNIMNHRWQWLEGIQIRDAKCLAVFENRLWVGGVEGIQAVPIE